MKTAEGRKNKSSKKADMSYSTLTKVTFGSREIGDGCPVVTIAEIGINHEGSATVCAEMIEAAAGAGADAIKLQTIDADENYVEGTNSHALFSRSALSQEETREMFALAHSHGIEAFTTTGDLPTLSWVEDLQPAAHKISSGLLTNIPYVRHAARTGRTLLISTGMADIEDIDEAIAAAFSSGSEQVALFQCTSEYPAPQDTLNLAAIGWLASRYRVPVGFSDHSVGIEAASLAVAAGARIIEKHFTLDSKRPGYDHRLSLEPGEFADLVVDVKNADVMLGQPEKNITANERSKAPEQHRCIVARCPIAEGEILTKNNVALKRPLPGHVGLAPKHYDSVLGRAALTALSKDHPIEWPDVGESK